MGHRPKPAALKLAEGRGNGRDSGGRVVQQPPAFKRLPPEPPVDLSDDAAELWREIVAELSRLEIVKEIDASALRACCEAWSRYRAAVRLRQERGIIAWGKDGGIDRVAPWVRAEETASQEFRRWCVEFGLTPASETKLSKGGDDDGEQGNPFAATG